MIPLLIDTDVALGISHEGRPRDIDDGFAIVEAINAPEIDLKGISTVFGNAPIEDVDRVARDIVMLKGATVPVASGAGAPLPAAGQLPDPNPAVIAMARQLRETPCHIAAIGPLTNIALLVEHYPGTLSAVESLIIVAGRSRDRRFFLGDAGPVRDFNFESDVRAAEVVMDTGLPLVLAGFELTSQVVITEHDLARIAHADSPTARYFHDNSQAWCRYWTEQFPTDDGFHPWDSAAISWLKHPEYFVSERRGWRIRRNEADDVHWLECDAQFPGEPITYCTGFKAGGAAGFVADVVDNVY